MQDTLIRSEWRQEITIEFTFQIIKIFVILWL
jgi:hypothetical protein